MRCASCGFENPEGTKFCGECGRSLMNRCPSCGAENPPQFKFCGECGTALKSDDKPAPAKSRKRKGAPNARKARRPGASPTTARSRPASPEAERRQLTVMFCDLVGSTALSEQLDPEELRTVILAYQETCAQIIQRFEGHLARYIGDGLLVYFSYPQAHEDDAQRAVRAGLEIIIALPQLNTCLQQTVRVLQHSPLQVRIGIHTGLVVVSDMGGGDYRDPMAIVGETPNIAARLQEKAKPNSVVISPSTYRLVTGLFECQDLGPQMLKGISTPLTVYQVVRESGARSRFEVAVTTGLTPLVGREEEVELLWQRWERVKEGTGQVVLLSGEPGIGKSRLVQALKEQIGQEEATQIEFRCSPYHQNSAFYPIIEHVQRLLQFQREETPQAKLVKLQQVLAAYRFPQADTLTLLAAWLSLPHPEGAPLLTLSPQKQKQKTQEALVAWIVEEAEKAAVYCVWEDLHWADPSTLEVLTLFLEQIPTTRVFTVLTFRPDFTPPWSPRSYLTQLMLSRLSHAQAEEMVMRVTGGKTLPPEVLGQVMSKTDGVPLFVEELTKMVVESGLVREANGHYELPGPLPPLAIPSTLQDSLMGRLDRLATIKEVAQLGATLGREFSYELLQAVSLVDEAALQPALARLVAAEILYQRGLPPQARYFFKHALIQDAAYQSLLKSARQQYHQQIAQILEERFPETVEIQPELLAHHYTEAGLIAQAIPYWQRAGQRALERSANLEAISHLTQGLGLLKTLPDNPERVQQELMLQITLGAPLIAIRGYASPEVEQTYARARALCREVGDTPQLFPVLWGLWVMYFVRGDLRTAKDLTEQLLRMARDTPDSALLLEACVAGGLTAVCLGEFSQALEHLEQGVTLYDVDQHSAHASLYGQDPGMVCLSWGAWVVWFLGYPDRAQQRRQAAVALARRLTHPYSLAYALGCASAVHQFRRVARETEQHAREMVALSAEQRFTLWLAAGHVVLGWSLADQGRAEEGVAELYVGLTAWQETGAGFMLSYGFALLSDTYQKTRQFDEGLAALTGAFAIVEHNGERLWEAELYRLKGELRLQSKSQSPESPTREAEACFLKAIDIARRQHAKSLELRAVMSLSRLWQQQGKKEKARQMLAEIYGWFTEGFDTRDLQEAKALLEELT